MDDTKIKPINYNFNSVDLKIIKNILLDFGFDKKFILLPFIGSGENIKTLFFQSETSNKAVVCCNNEYLFIKEIPWYLSDEERIKIIYNINYNLLYAISDKIPLLYKNVKNNNYFTKIHNKYYLLMNYIEGDEWSGSCKQAYNIGFELAKIHKNFVLDKKIKSKYYKTIFSSAEDMIKLAKKEFLIKQLKTYAKELKNYRGTASVVYGDSNPSNYLFNKDKLKAIVDFDNLKYDNPVRDLAETIIAFAIVKYKYNTSSFEKIFNPIDEKITASIVNGYMLGLNDKKLFLQITGDLKVAIKIMLLLFYSLAFLKDSEYNEKYKTDMLKLDFIDCAIKKVC